MSAFDCRAILLLQKELFKAKQQDLWGIKILNGEDEDLLNWKVVISGLKGTLMQDAEFKVCLKFNDSFNETPPSIYFVDVIPFHPNVSTRNGEVCLGIIENWKSTKFTIISVLLTLQQLLSEPYSFKKAWNQNAVRTIKETPKHYKQLVLDTVLDSQRKYATGSTLTFRPDELQRSGDTAAFSPMPTNRTPKTVFKIENDVIRTKAFEELSYESYLKNWKEIGTTKPDSSDSNHNEVLSLLDEKYEFGTDPVKEKLHGETYEKLSDYHRLMYGNFSKDAFHKKKHDEMLKENKVQLLKDLHLNKKRIKSLQIAVPTSPPHAPQRADDIGRLEASELINWTQNLHKKDFKMKEEHS